LKFIRSKPNTENLILRVDANGAFTFEQAKKVLEELEALNIHSIEQPIKAGSWAEMAELCKLFKVGIALDEELIGVQASKAKEELLDAINPQYLILKPTLLGGFAHCQEWINFAQKRGIGYWFTSALESNIGLNSICQIASQLHVEGYQGLGTGSLYHNNISSPLKVDKGFIFNDLNLEWGESSVLEI
jgi:L-alanine-DL-glutamate epimerase-like enolase superfamily enzyme